MKGEHFLPTSSFSLFSLVFLRRRLRRCFRGRRLFRRLRARERAPFIHGAAIFHIDRLRHCIGSVHRRLGRGGSNRLRRRRSGADRCRPSPAAAGDTKHEHQHDQHRRLDCSFHEHLMDGYRLNAISLTGFATMRPRWQSGSGSVFSVGASSPPGLQTSIPSSEIWNVPIAGSLLSAASAHRIFWLASLNSTSKLTTTGSTSVFLPPSFRSSKTRWD